MDERTAANFVTVGIAITQMYTDNALLSTSPTISDLSYDMEPHIALNYSAPRFSYDMGVLAGFLVNRTLDDRNQAKQTGAFDLSYHMSQFVMLRLSDSFQNTTGLWSGLDTSSSSEGTGVGVVETPNSSLLTYEHFRSNTALAELSTQFSPSSFAGMRGTQTHLWFPSGTTDPVAGELYVGDSYSAELFYNHRFTKRNWGGVTARAQRFDLDHSVGRTDALSLVFLYAVNIRPTTSLSFLGGPELVMTANPQGITPLPVFQRRMWSPMGGAAFNSVSRSTIAAVSFVHTVSDSGGLISAVTLDSVDSRILHRLGRRFSIGPGFGYAHDSPIVPGPAFRVYSARLQSSLRLGDCSFSGGYTRDDRSAVGSSATASANGVWISFSYDFIKQIGR
jgi:hypothetical protein